MSEHSSKTITVSREELYDQVWSTPMRKLATKYGLSLNDLIRACKQFQIPRPSVGYWAKKMRGQSPPQESLPACDDSSRNSIQIQIGVTGKGEVLDPDELKFDADVTEQLRRVREAPKIVVPGSLRKPHPLIKITGAALNEGFADRHNLICPRRNSRNEALSIQVAKTSIRRALLLMDTLVKSVERFGGRIANTSDRRGERTCVEMLGEMITDIRLRERYKQVPRKDASKDPFGPSCDCVPLGLFVLDTGYVNSTNFICQDTPKQRIEDAINKILIDWVQEAGKVRINRRRTEEEERIRRQQVLDRQRRQQELQARQKAEQDRLDGLLARAASWKQSKDLRDYVDAVERFVIKRDGAIDEGSEAQKWLTWARQQADRFDPLVPKPPSVLDERIE